MSLNLDSEAKVTTFAETSNRESYELPFHYNFQRLALNSRVALRILSLSDEHVFRYPVVKATKKTINGSLLTIRVPDLGSEIMSTIVDATGTPLNMLTERQYAIRIPVFVYEATEWRSKGKDKETEKSLVEYNTVKWIELTPGTHRDLIALNNVETQNGALAFNPKTHRPDYDLILRVVPQVGFPKSYEWEPVTVQGTVGKSNFGPHARYGKPLKEVLSPWWSDIEASWDNLMAAMRLMKSPDEIASEFRSVKAEAKESGLASHPMADVDFE